MPRFRKKPVEIEAVQFVKPYARVKEFCPDLVLVADGFGGKVAFAMVKTLEGDMRADIGDWVIRGVKGEFYPCKPDIFDATYELVQS